MTPHPRILGVAARSGMFPPGPVHYDNGQVLVPVEDLRKTQARIAELEREQDAALVKAAQDGYREGVLHRRDYNRAAAERDRWKAAYEKATQALPEPDIDIPGDLRRAANIIDAWVGPHDSVTADGLRTHADRLESEATADDVMEKVECWCHIIPNCAACQGREADRLRGDR